MMLDMVIDDVMYAHDSCMCNNYAAIDLVKSLHFLVHSIILLYPPLQEYMYMHVPPRTTFVDLSGYPLKGSLIRYLSVVASLCVD